MPSHALSALALLVTLCSCNERSDTPDFGKPATDGIVDIKVDVKGPDQVLLPDRTHWLDVGHTPDKGPPSGTAWIFTSGGGGNIYTPNVATDKVGSVYVAGSLVGVNKFGSNTVGTNGQWGLFVLKLDTTGKLKWVAYAPCDDWIYAYKVAVDSMSNTYITGFIRGRATFGSTTLTPSGWGSRKKDLYVAKLDAKGKYLWATRVGSFQDDYGYGIGLDGADNAYITGSFRDVAKFGSITLTAAGKLGSPFVAKLNSKGSFLWAVTCGGDGGYDIAVDSSGSSHIVGVFEGTENFGKHSLSASKATIFVAKLNSSGKFLWATAVQSLSMNAANAIGLDGAGNTYLQDAVELAKLDKDGKLLWTKSLCSFSGTANGYIVASDNLGSSYISGKYWDSLKCGAKAISGGGVYIVKANSNGKPLWAASATVGPRTTDLTTFGGAVIATGTYGSNAVFGSRKVPYPGGGYQVYVWKLFNP